MSVVDTVQDIWSQTAYGTNESPHTFFLTYIFHGLLTTETVRNVYLLKDLFQASTTVPLLKVIGKGYSPFE